MESAEVVLVRLQDFGAHATLKRVQNLYMYILQVGLAPSGFPPLQFTTGSVAAQVTTDPAAAQCRHILIPYCADSDAESYK